MTTRIADEIVVAANGGVSIAPVGSTLPTDASAALDAAFIDVGYISEDGVSFSPNLSTESIMAWQSFSPVRKVQTEQAFSIDFTMMQWNKTSMETAFGGGLYTNNGDGTWEYLPPAPGEDLTRAMVIDGIDGARNYRIVVPRFSIEDLGDVAFARGEFSPLEVTASALAESAVPFEGRAWRMLGDGIPVIP